LDAAALQFWLADVKGPYQEACADIAGRRSDAVRSKHRDMYGFEKVVINTLDEIPPLRLGVAAAAKEPVGQQHAVEMTREQVRHLASLERGQGGDFAGQHGITLALAVVVEGAREGEQDAALASGRPLALR